MPDVYRIFGSELSPYSVKVRSYFRYKQLPHEWVLRSTANQAEFDQHAKLPLIPLVITPEGQAMQDSTPILEQLEQRFPEPSIHPEDAKLRFLSELIEEYGDEWGNKPMFHYRWFYEADRESAARRIARQMMPDLPEENLAGAAEMIKGRMVPRLSFVGSSPETKDQIEGSFHRQLSILERHLTSRPYLFGARPAFGDFALFAQLHQCWTDPTPGAVMRSGSGNVVTWIERMLTPKNEGPFENWDTLAPTLMPLLRDEIAEIFFPWSVANAKAIDAGEKEFTLNLGGAPFSQEAQKYHAKSLRALRQKYAAVRADAVLSDILKQAGCLEPLAQ
jgi:glutathione S-transferase